MSMMTKEVVEVEEVAVVVKLLPVEDMLNMDLIGYLNMVIYDEVDYDWLKNVADKVVEFCIEDIYMLEQAIVFVVLFFFFIPTFIYIYYF